MSVTQVMGHRNFTALFISAVSNFIPIPSPRNTPGRNSKVLRRPRYKYPARIDCAKSDWLDALRATFPLRSIQARRAFSDGLIRRDTYISITHTRTAWSLLRIIMSTCTCMAVC